MRYTCLIRRFDGQGYNAQRIFRETLPDIRHQSVFIDLLSAAIVVQFINKWVDGANQREIKEINKYLYF